MLWSISFAFRFLWLVRPTHQSEYEHLPPQNGMNDKEVWKWLETKKPFGAMPKFSELTGDFRTKVRVLEERI